MVATTILMSTTVRRTTIWTSGDDCKPLFGFYNIVRCGIISPASHVETRHTKLIYISQQNHLATPDNCSTHPVPFLALKLSIAVSVWHIGSSYRCCVEWGIDLERLWARAVALPLAKLSAFCLSPLRGVRVTSLTAKSMFVRHRSKRARPLRTVVTVKIAWGIGLD